MASQTSARRSAGARGNGAWPRPRLYTIEEYERMARAGIFCEDERVELLDGVIYAMSPIHPPHATCLRRLIYTFASRIGDRGILDAQDPVRLPPISMPQPDIVILKPRADFYLSGHPVPNDALLVIEISDTTFRFDRNRKIPRSAAAGCREAWRVDPKRDRVLVYRDPQDSAYTESTEHRRGDTMSAHLL